MADKQKTVKLYHPRSTETQVEVSEARAEALQKRGWVTNKAKVDAPKTGD